MPLDFHQLFQDMRLNGFPGIPEQWNSNEVILA